MDPVLFLYLQTALLVAVTANHPYIAHDLIMLGADINMVDDKGQTALHLAATYGFLEVIQVGWVFCLFLLTNIVLGLASATLLQCAEHMHPYQLIFSDKQQLQGCGSLPKENSIANH